MLRTSPAPQICGIVRQDCGPDGEEGALLRLRGGGPLQGGHEGRHQGCLTNQSVSAEFMNKSFRKVSFLLSRAMFAVL